MYKKIFVPGYQLNSAIHGLVAIYLLNEMGLETSGRIVAAMTIYLFISLVITTYTAETFIRGFKHKFGGYKKRVRAILLEIIFILFSIILFLYSYFSTQQIEEILISSIPMFFAFGQISFNHLIQRDNYGYLSAAMILDSLFCLFVVIIYAESFPSLCFIILTFSKWVFINVSSCLCLLNQLDFAVKKIIHRLNILWNYRFLCLERPDSMHVVNLGLKYFWNTLDTLVVSYGWSDSAAGAYKLSKTLGGIPSLVFGAFWTVKRKLITSDWKSNKLSQKFKTISRNTILFSLPMPLIILFSDNLLELINGTRFFSFDVQIPMLISFCIWWLVSSCFGWMRFFTLTQNYLNYSNIQNGFLCFLLIASPFFAIFIDPIIFFPAIMLVTNFILITFLSTKGKYA